MVQAAKFPNQESDEVVIWQAHPHWSSGLESIPLRLVPIVCGVFVVMLLTHVLGIFHTPPCLYIPIALVTGAFLIEQFMSARHIQQVITNHRVIRYVSQDGGESQWQEVQLEKIQPGAVELVDTAWAGRVFRLAHISIRDTDGCELLLASVSDPDQVHQTILEWCTLLRKLSVDQRLDVPSEQEELLARLRQLPSLAYLSIRELQEVSKLTRVINVRRGRVVARQGEWGGETYMLMSGKAVLQATPIRSTELRSTQYLKPGDFFGDDILQIGEIWKATVRSTTDTTWLVIDRSKFDEWLAENPDIRSRLNPAIAGLPHIDWLQPSEQIVFYSPRHWVAIVGTSLSSWYWTFLALAIAAILLSGECLGFMGLFIVWGLIRIVSWRSQHFVVTSERIVDQQGWLPWGVHRRVEIPIGQVQGAFVRYTPFPLLAEVRTVMIQTSTTQMEARAITRADGLGELIVNQAQLWRDRQKAQERRELREALESELAFEIEGQISQRTPADRQEASQALSDQTLTWRQHWLRGLLHAAFPGMGLLSVVYLFGANEAKLFPFDLLGVRLVPELFAVLLLLLLAWFLWKTLKWSEIRYILTTTSVSKVEGYRLVQRIELGSVTNAKVQPISDWWANIGWLADIGHVIVEGTDTLGPLSLTWLGNPEAIRREILLRTSLIHERQRQEELAQRRGELVEWLGVYDQVTQERHSLAALAADPNLAGYLKILVVVSSPLDPKLAPIDAWQEWRNLMTGLQIGHYPVVLARLVPPRWQDLQAALSAVGVESGFSIVHFIGHGTQQELILEDEYGSPNPIGVDDIVDVFRASSVGLVFLNVCDSKALGTVLVGGGVRAVVAMDGEIPDELGVILSELFYPRLAAGSTISQAIEQTKSGIRREIMERARREGSQDLGLKQIEQLAREHADMIVLLGHQDAKFALAGDQAGVPEIESQEPRHNLPAPREAVAHSYWRELRAIARALKVTEVRFVVIWGGEGVGKSAVAVLAAHRNVWRFPGGVVRVDAEHSAEFSLSRLLVEIESLVDPELGASTRTMPGQVGLHVLQRRIAAIERKLGTEITEAEIRSREYLVLNTLQSASLGGRPVLLVIDNLDNISASVWHDLLRFLRQVDPHYGSKVIFTIQQLPDVLRNLPGTVYLKLGL